MTKNFKKMKSTKFIIVVVLSTIVLLQTCLGVNAVESRATAEAVLKSGYAHGSYYTTTGNACSNHNSCITFAGGSRCVGFARYVYYVMHGVTITSHGNGAPIDISGYTNTQLYNLLSSLGNNAYLFGKTASGSDHAIFVTSFTSSTVMVYEANYDQKCGVTFQGLSYSGFKQRISTLIYCASPTRGINM